ncbi:MAG: tonB dependent receptor family protein [Verrucomicrobiaceae bacterium]|nr:tonB dependent receptor family protein [Verrucomicrobiaceae bacterium]
MKPVFLLVSILVLASSINAQTTTELPEVSVVGHLDQDRNEIVPALGATSYSISSQRLETQTRGADAPFNETLLRIPGVAQDSFGQLHVRGDHANLQYRINDVLIPEGISGFGQELDTRFVDHLSLITGALPAQFGYRTAGIVDIHTKSGDDLKGGEISMYGGSYGTLRPSLEYGGVDGRLTYYFTASYLQSDIGIENPTSRPRAIHDNTQQEKFFGSISYLIDDTSRLNLLLSSSYGHFQIPNNPNQTPAFTLSGVRPFNSSLLNENQQEQNDYAILSYQKSAGDLNYQISAFARYSGLLYNPDPTGDLIFNGVAGRIDRNIFSTGLQGDASYRLNDSHTLRGGLSFTSERATVNTSTSVFATDPFGMQSSSDPFTILDDSRKQAYLYGAYLQDEWKIDALTINFGARFDVSDAFLRENQLSPRINFVYELTESTTLHAGYARYFTPPPLELVQQSSISKFANTTNAPASIVNSPVQSERDHYFDIGATEKLSKSFQIGLDGYYKRAQNLLDEGQFGQALIFSPFNYQQGKVYGVEFTANYQQDNFAAYGNLAFSRATASDIISGQFEFDPAELDYIKHHDVFLDHDERLAASVGTSYTWAGTRFAADLLYGSGLRAGFANTQKLGVYYPLNLGVSHTFDLGGGHKLKARIDLVNVLDQVYELRDGSGIGVGAPQFGQRRGIYFGLGYTF